MLLPLLEPTVLLARPEAFEATEACDLLASTTDLRLCLCGSSGEPLLLPLLEPTVLLARPEAFEATEACDLADLWLAPEADLTLVLELDLPDLDVKELCLEVLIVLARSTPGFLPDVWPDFHAIGLLHVLPLDEKRSQR